MKNVACGPRRPLRLPGILTLVAIAALAGGCSKKDGGSSTPTPPTGPTGGATATVTGIVLSGGSGLPLPGVMVTSSPSAATGIMTNSFGIFTLTVPANQVVAVHFGSTAYATHPISVGLSTSETRAVAVVLTPVGASQSVFTASGGKVTDPVTKSCVTVPAGFVAGTSTAQVRVTGIFPNQPQVVGMPGSFAARTTLGAESTLEPFTMAEVTVDDGAGTAFSLSQPVDIELHLPDGLATDARILSGQPVPCLRYDAAAGEWKAFGSADVVNSSVDGKKVVKITVNSLSWFAAGYLNGSNSCATGVVRSGGLPVSGVTVQAYPGESDVTGSDGVYRVNVPALATARLVAARAGTGTVNTGSATVTGGKIGTGCVDQNLTITGSAPASSYTMDARLTRGRDGIGVPRDFVAIRIVANDGPSTPLSGAHIVLTNGSNTFDVPNTSPGSYVLISGGGFSLTPGTEYSLSVDLEPDGVVDANASVLMPGVPQITAPIEDATTDSSFIAEWFDPLAGQPGYLVRYVGSVESQSFGTFPAIFALDSPAASRTIGDGNGQPQYSMPNNPLITGLYLFRLWATNGPIRYPVGGTTQFNTPNVSSSRVIGYFSATAQADSVHFNAVSSGVPRPAGPAYFRRR